MEVKLTSILRRNINYDMIGNIVFLLFYTNGSICKSRTYKTYQKTIK